MSIEKQHINKKQVAAGAALVALSGFVPAPFAVAPLGVNPAQAVSATINVTASFLTGLKFAAKSSLKFGKLVATDITGSAVFEPKAATNSVSSTSNVKTVGTVSAVGQATIKASLTGVPINVKISKLGAMSRAATASGGSTGTIQLNKIKIDSAALTGADVDFTAVGTADTETIQRGATAQVDLLLGGTISWSGTRPVGVFTQGLVFTLNY